MKKNLLVVFLILLFVAGCAPKQRVVQKVQGGKPPVKIAILPSINLSNDILGGIVIRNLIYQRFMENNKNYEVQDVAITDALLIGEGISEGGLLNLMSNLELCQLLEVDGLVYIDVYDMGMKILPFYHSRYVDFQVRLYNFDRLVWQKPVNIANRVVDVEGALGAINDISAGNYEDGLVDAGTSVAVQTAVKIGVATLSDHELKPEFLMGVDEFYLDLPVGRSGNMEALVEVNEKLDILNKQKEAGEDLSLGEELEVEEELIDIGETGVNIIND